MTQTYRIHWHDPSTGRRGVGTKEFNQAQAEHLARELNAEHPHLEHEAVRLVKDGENECGGYYCSEEHGHIDCQKKPEPSPIAADFKRLTDTDRWPNWGAHAGKLMRDVPSSYLDWMMGQPQLLRAWPAIADYIQRSKKAIAQDLERDDRR